MKSGISQNKPAKAHQIIKSNSEVSGVKFRIIMTMNETVYDIEKMNLIEGIWIKLLLTRFENFGFCSKSTVSRLCEIFLNNPDNVVKKPLKAKMITAKKAPSYRGFNANRAGFEKTMARPRRGNEKYINNVKFSRICSGLPVATSLGPKPWVIKEEWVTILATAKEAV